MSLHEPNVRGRYTIAQRRLHELAPTIYTKKRIEANLRAADRISEHELLGFLLAAEWGVRRREARKAH